MTKADLPTALAQWNTRANTPTDPRSEMERVIRDLAGKLYHHAVTKYDPEAAERCIQSAIAAMGTIASSMPTIEQALRQALNLQGGSDEVPGIYWFFGHQIDIPALARAVSSSMPEIDVERLHQEARRMWTLAAATIERDVLLHGMTDDEQMVMIGAVLNAAERIADQTEGNGE